MTALAAIRTGHVGVPLFVHVLGAMLLVGTLLVVAAAIVAGWRREEPGDAAVLTRYALRTVLFGVVPAYVVMRVGAQWTESASGYPDSFSATWLDIGYLTADAGAVLVLVSIVLAVVGLRRMRSGAGGPRLARAVGVIAVLLLAAYLVAVWAMAGKPQ